MILDILYKEIYFIKEGDVTLDFFSRFIKEMSSFRFVKKNQESLITVKGSRLNSWAVANFRYFVQLNPSSETLTMQCLLLYKKIVFHSIELH